jgi:hypothetical protein
VLDADLQSLKPVYSPLEPLRELLFTHISLSGAELLVVPLLFSSIQYVTEAISDRNRLVETWRENRPENLAALYFGLPYGGVIDQRYGSTLQTIYSQTDDTIAFAIILAEALYKDAQDHRQTFRKKFHPDGPTINKITFKRFEAILPPPENYKHFSEMFASAANVKLGF